MDRWVSRTGVALVAAALSLGLFGRWAAGWNTPLWFDETFSGVIASQPRFADMVRWCLNEMTGPGYYGLLWAWEKIAGNSNAALRLPSFILSAAAPMLVLWRGPSDRELRGLWAIFLALWMPALAQGSEARAYAELLFLDTLQSILFLRAVAAPRTAPLFWWCAVSVWAVLTHYSAAPLAGLEGLALLVLHRRAALACWPALLPLVPLGLWIRYHFAFMARLTLGGGGWFHQLKPADILQLPAVLFGSPIHGAIILCLVAFGLMFAWRARSSERGRLTTPEAVLAFCGMLAYLLVFALGFFWPSFAPRYMTPAVPAVLFALALWGKAVLRVNAKLVALVIAMFFIIAGGTIRAHLIAPSDDARYFFNFERPTYWAMAAHPKRLIFLWDSPLGAASDASTLAEVSGFFFARAGNPVQVEVVRVPQGSDAGKTLMAAAAGRRDTAILWLPDFLSSRGAVPTLAGDPRHACRDFGRGEVAIIACRAR